MKSGKIYRIAALLLALLVALSLSSICVFADGDDATATGAGDTTTTGAGDTTTTGTDDATATGSDDATATGSGDTTTTGTDDATATGSDDATATGSGDTTTTGAGDTTTTGTEEETTAATGDTTGSEKTINWDLIITLSVIGLAVIVFFIFFFANATFRAKVQKFLKDIKSELSKVVWSPWRDVKKNTVIVIVVSLGAALLIFILDMLFSKGLSALTTLVR